MNSPEEIDQLISEANRTVFSTSHRHVALIAGRMNEILEEVADQWDIFFVEKEKEEELKRPKTIRVYQKDRDKGKGKEGGPLNLKITDNLPPPLSDTPPVELVNKQPATESMEAPLEDTNLESEVLYTMNIDTQEVNIMVDKETTEDKKKDVATEPLALDVEVGVSETINISTKKPTDTEKPAEDTTEKPYEALVNETEKQSEVNTEKPKVHTETTSDSEKSSKAPE